MKKVVLDTNVLLVSISTKSKLHWIFKNLLEGNYILCLTTDILAEYAETHIEKDFSSDEMKKWVPDIQNLNIFLEEIIEQQMGSLASESALGVLENLPNVEFITNYYKFNLLKDPDDNKFVDCAISSNADFIVTHDSDFNILKKIEFPKVIILNTSELKTVLI